MWAWYGANGAMGQTRFLYGRWKLCPAGVKTVSLASRVMERGTVQVVIRLYSWRRLSWRANDPGRFSSHHIKIGRSLPEGNMTALRLHLTERTQQAQRAPLQFS